MAANSLIPFPHSGTIQIVRAFQYGILAELFLQTQHDFLELLFLFQLRGVCEQINLEDALVLNHAVGRNDNSSYSQGLVCNLIE